MPDGIIGVNRLPVSNGQVSALIRERRATPIHFRTALTRYEAEDSAARGVFVLHIKTRVSRG
jgi:hypothetical protein